MVCLIVVLPILAIVLVVKAVLHRASLSRRVADLESAVKDLHKKTP